MPLRIVFFLLLPFFLLQKCNSQKESPAILQFEETDHFLELLQAFKNKNARLTQTDPNSRKLTDQFLPEEIDASLVEIEKLQQTLDDNPNASPTEVEEYKKSILSKKTIEIQASIRSRYSPSKDANKVFKIKLLEFRRAHPEISLNEIIEALNKNTLRK